MPAPVTCMSPTAFATTNPPDHNPPPFPGAGGRGPDYHILSEQSTLRGVFWRVERGGGGGRVMRAHSAMVILAFVENVTRPWPFAPPGSEAPTA